jgi:flagellar biosynthesis/type III secretory pathway M-ring protein FliF/YscJ
MQGLRRLRRGVALVLAVVMFVVSMPLGVAQAALVSTEQMLAGGASAADRARVLAFLDRAEIREQIAALGVDPNEAAARVAALSDEQVREIAGQLDQLPAGQGAVAAVIGAILIIFLVLLITDLLGLTNVFPFVKR